MCLFYLILRSGFDVSFLTSISVSTVVLTLGKLNFLNKLISETFHLFNFVNFKIKQWFLAYQDQFCAWFSLARLPTETARSLFCSFSKRASSNQ